MNNAIAVFNYANNSTQKLRQQADSVTEFQRTAAEREADFNSRLIEIFGYPYADDIGAGRTYPDQGYGTGQRSGSVSFHVCGPLQIAGDGQPGRVNQYQIPVVENDTPLTGQHLTIVGGATVVATNMPWARRTNYISFHFAPNGFGLVRPMVFVARSRKKNSCNGV